MELEGRGKIWNEDCWKLWRRVWVQGGIFTGPARLIEGLFTVEASVDVLMATGGKVYTLGWFCLYRELSMQPWSGSWLLDLTEEVDVLGWPLCRVRVMVSRDVRWFVSGALYRKMVPLWLAAGVTRLASPLEFQLQWPEPGSGGLSPSPLRRGTGQNDEPACPCLIRSLGTIGFLAAFWRKPCGFPIFL